MTMPPTTMRSPRTLEPSTRVTSPFNTTRLPSTVPASSTGPPRIATSPPTVRQPGCGCGRRNESCWGCCRNRRAGRPPWPEAPDRAATARARLRQRCPEQRAGVRREDKGEGDRCLVHAIHRDPPSRRTALVTCIEQTRCRDEGKNPALVRLMYMRPESGPCQLETPCVHQTHAVQLPARHRRRRVSARRGVSSGGRGWGDRCSAACRLGYVAGGTVQGTLDQLPLVALEQL